MNLILLFPDDFAAPDRVFLTGRRLEHVREVHRAREGDVLTVGVAGGNIGVGTIMRIARDLLEMAVDVQEEPPPALPMTLVLALPRPKVLNRVLLATASLGIKELHLVNAWRVEKSYWDTPRLSPANLRDQSILGLEQSRDTVLPRIALHRFFREFAEEVLPEVAADSLRLVAHPYAASSCPHAVQQRVTLAIGPEGGWVDAEIESFRRAGFTPVSLGARILRVETAVPYLTAMLFRGGGV